METKKSRRQGRSITKFSGLIDNIKDAASYCCIGKFQNTFISELRLAECSNIPSPAS